MDLGQVIQDRFTLHADDKAFEVEGRWSLWQDVHEIADRVDQLLVDVGVGGAGTPIGIIGRNRLTHMAAVLALFRGRRPICCIHNLLPPEGLAQEVRHLNLAAIIADEEDWAIPALNNAARETGTVGIMVSDRGRIVNLVPGLEKLGPGAHRESEPDVAVEILTSGTTGYPKRIPIMWNTVNQSMEDVKKVLVQNFHKTAEEPSVPPIRIQYVPLGNMSGIWVLLASALDGYPTVVFEKFDVTRWAETIRRYRPHYVGLVPNAIKMVLDANVPAEDLSSVQVLNAGGSKLDPDVQRSFEQKYGLKILLSYGATEFFGAIAAWSMADRLEYGEKKLGSTGRARPGVNLRVVDQMAGVILPNGKTGLLEVQIARTGADWVRTTDLASLDDDGFLYIHGRSDGAISRGGFKILPQEIVQVLCQHPSVSDASVVGLPDDRLGEVPVAAVELKPGAKSLSAAELESFAREHLVRYKVPTRFMVVDKLPRTASLKVSAPEIKALFAAEHL